MKPPPRPRKPLPRDTSPPLTPAIEVTFDPFEAPTPTANVKLLRYQKLVACIDHLDPKASDDLVEIACLFTDATEDERATMLRVCRAVPRP